MRDVYKAGAVFPIPVPPRPQEAGKGQGSSRRRRLSQGPLWAAQAEPEGGVSKGAAGSFGPADGTGVLNGGRVCYSPYIHAIVYYGLVG